ncbi:HDL162Wp [Eremothecium sinecaudum]|uniref:HDL162Wp n=1 Tax=Eremothecium sinecaudum TaxID=45286 RepID=A0A109UYZ8_9SACH|nr:HDL162Wp [Eremothecium sinecaudum]AMD20582.1 HDL162Wp [Eremothecium sinecaudum]
MLVPPANFGIAEEGIYRCSRIETINLSFLEVLALRSILFVGGQEPSKFFREFFERCNIQVYVIKRVHITSTLAPSGTTVTKEQTAEESDFSSGYQSASQYRLSDSDDLMIIKSHSLQKIFKLILDILNHNTLLVDKTSVVIGILRKIQKWNISSIIDEYRLYTGKNSSYFAETFLEVVNINVIQDIEKNATEHLSRLDLNDETSALDTDGRSSSGENVNENDLLDNPDLPQHILRLIDQVEQQTSKGENGATSAEMKRIPSDKGIFGNRYRLAFNKREIGEYEYYKGEGANLVHITIPRESLLPQWFKFQRDLWEQQNTKEMYNFYTEKVFI